MNLFIGSEIIKRNYNFIAQALFCVVFLSLPYVVSFTLLIILSMIIVTIKEDFFKYNKLFSILMAIILFFFSALPVVTKVVNSDKIQYSDYVKLHYGENIFHWLFNFSGFDFISWFSLKVSSELLGVGNGAFLLFYLICFIPLFLGIVRLNGNTTFLTFMMFIPQYVFDSFYANTIRQGLAFSFFILAISLYQNKKRYVFYILSFLSHFSFIIYLPAIFLLKKIKNIGTKLALVFYTIAYFVGGVIAPLLFKYMGGVSSFFNDRVDAYKNADFGVDPVKRLIMTIIFMVTMELIEMMVIGRAEKTQTHKVIRFTFIFMVCVYFFTLSFEEVANRYSFNVMGFFFVYLSSSILQMRSKLFKHLITLVIVILTSYIFIYMLYNRGDDLYFGNYPSIIGDGFYTIFTKAGIL